MMAFSTVIKEMSIIPRVRSPTTPTKPRSPKRAFSTSKSRLIQALDAASSDAPSVAVGSKDLMSTVLKMHSSDEDPFGGVWPPKKQNRLIRLTSDDGVVTSPIRKLSLPLSQDNTVAGELKRQEAIASSSKHENSGPKVQSKPVSKGSKENASTGAPSAQVKQPSPKALPKYSYKDYKPSPARVYVRHIDEADDLVGALSGPLGFDLEWRVVYRRGAPERPAATVQICDRRMILVIQVTAMKGFPKKLKEVLEDPKIPKMGVNILNDGIKLARDYGVRPQGLVELGGLARQADAGYVDRYFSHASPKSPPMTASTSASTDGSTGETTAPKMRKPGFMISLATITAMYTEHSLSKGPVRTSNWEAQPLSEAQLEYAANDAHCALMVYQTLMDMAQKAGVTLDASKFTQNVKFFYGSKSDTNKPKSAAPRIGSATSASSSASNATTGVQSTTGSDKADSNTEVVQSGNGLAPSTQAGPGPKSRPPSSKPPSGAVRQRPQHIRAYNLWYHKQSSIPDMCATLRSPDNPLKVGTVIGYVVGALQADPSLHFHHNRLTNLLKAEEASWNRHKDWYTNLDAAVYVNMSKLQT